MADRPFIAVIKTTLTANGEGTGQYNVGSGNTFTINRILQKATGACDITGMQDQFGNDFTNASVDNPLDINTFCDIGADNNVPADLVNPIVIKGNGKLEVDLKDTSGSSNTVFLYLIGMLTN